MKTTTPLTPAKELARCVARYDPEIGRLAMAMRRRLRTLMPMAFELVYDNYNALAIGYAPTERASDAIVSIALYPRWVNLFFLEGKSLADPNGLLKGNGKRVRHITVRNVEEMEVQGVRDLLAKAIARSSRPFPPTGRNRTIIKSISERQRSRRPA